MKMFKSIPLLFFAVVSAGCAANNGAHVSDAPQQQIEKPLVSDYLDWDQRAAYTDKCAMASDSIVSLDIKMRMCRHEWRLAKIGHVCSVNITIDGSNTASNFAGSLRIAAEEVVCQ